MIEIEKLRRLGSTMNLPEIHARLRDTNEINIALPTLRSWYYGQRTPDQHNQCKLKRALAKIKARHNHTIAIRVTANNPDAISTSGVQDGVIVILGQEIEIANRQLITTSNPRLFGDLHRLLSKHTGRWLKIMPDD